MLEVGTNVFVKRQYKEDRPISATHSIYFELTDGVIAGCLGDGYYEVNNPVRDDGAIHVIHEDEMVDMDTYKPKFKVGDKVRICDISVEEKRRYLVKWVEDMDDYIGQEAIVTEIHEWPDTYTLDDIMWTWHTVNLKYVSQFVGF